MNEAMISAWNKRVTGKDTVYIAGDMFFRCEDPESILKRLKGKKRLILGNHDGSWTGKVDLPKYFVSVDTMLKFSPKFFFVLEVVVEFHLYYHHSISRHGFCFFFVDFLVGEDIFFERFCELLLHFGGSLARIYGNDNSLSDSDIRELIFVDAVKSVNTKNNQHNSNEHYNLSVMHRRFHYISFLFHFFNYEL